MKGGSYRESGSGSDDKWVNERLIHEQMYGWKYTEIVKIHGITREFNERMLSVVERENALLSFTHLTSSFLSSPHLIFSNLFSSHLFSSHVISSHLILIYAG